MRTTVVLSSTKLSAGLSHIALLVCVQRDVYRTIAGLSYNGDPRMAVSEDPGKVDQIVEGSFDGT